MSQEIVYGTRTVEEILKARKRAASQLYVEINKHGPQIEEIVRLAKRNNVKITRLERRDMARKAKDGNYQGVILVVEATPVLSLSEAIAQEPDIKNAVWLAIDEITDPQNLGSMIRSAACLGASAVILPERRTVGITPGVHKAACGALETVKIIEVGNLNHTLIALKEQGFWIYGTDTAGTQLPSVSFNLPMALIIGSEGKGMRQKTGEHCDEVIAIPQRGGVESLNAACACSVVLYDIAVKTGKWKSPQ